MRPTRGGVYYIKITSIMIIHQNEKFVKCIDKFEFLLYNITIKAANAAVRQLCQRLLRDLLWFDKKNRRQLEPRAVITLTCVCGYYKYPL